MKSYEKPIAVAVEDMSEGVYAASGGAASDSDCYTTTARIHQTPQTGRGDYRIQVDAVHNADHMSNKQLLEISFNQAVTYVSCNGNGATLRSGDGSITLYIELTYTQNYTDNIGFGDLVVTSDPGLSVAGVVMHDKGSYNN